MRQPTDLRIYRDENGISSVSLSLVNAPREDGVTVREDILIPATSWFKDPINELYLALVDLAEMLNETPPCDENFEENNQ